MQTRDHKELAFRLLRETDSKSLCHHRRAFLLGCVEPDYNLLTYVRGSLRHRFCRGHNAENVAGHLRRCLTALQTAAPRSALDCFRLGTLVHYVADSFTFPHNGDFPGSLLAHAAYEKKLHGVFERELSGFPAKEGTAPRSAWGAFTAERREYAGTPRSMETDCAFILRTCADVLDALLRTGAPVPCAAGGEGA